MICFSFFCFCTCMHDWRTCSKRNEREIPRDMCVCVSLACLHSKNICILFLMLSFQLHQALHIYEPYACTAQRVVQINASIVFNSLFVHHLEILLRPLTTLLILFITFNIMRYRASLHAVLHAIKDTAHNHKYLIVWR